MKNSLLRALDGIIAELREATAAIQRDDFEDAIERLQSAQVRIRQQATELRSAA